MEELHTVSLEKVIEEFSLSVVHLPDLPENILISNKHVNRPGLSLAGFYDHFEHTRIQLIGKAEHMYLQKFDSAERLAHLRTFMSHVPACIIFTSSLEIFPEALSAAEEFAVPLLLATENTSELMSALIAFLNIQLAPRMTRHGVLVEVYGEGVLLLGDSGIGKSETAIELVKRGHRLIADDAVELKRVSAKTIVGSAPEIIRHFVELRGIGIVDIRRIFGMGAVKMSEKVDMIIKLEPWDKNKIYDRIGLEQETTNILGNEIVTTTIPVRPGRNLAIILEIAAMNNRQRRMGYNTAEEFNKRIMEQMCAPKEED